MRTLSVIELDLVVGGYDSQAASYDYGSSSISADVSGNFSGTVNESDAQAMQANATASGWDYGVDFKVGNGGSWSVGGHVSRKS